MPKSAERKWFGNFLKNKKTLEEYGSSRNVDILWENVWEPSFDFFDRIITEQPGTKLCLDIGHAHCFSSFSPVEFLQRYASFISHVHLHDNKGDQDSHDALGEGTIDFNSLSEAFKKVAVQSFTFELTEEKFLSSQDVIRRYLFL